MDLSLSSEQRQLVNSFAALFARESSLERVRAAEPAGFDRRLWEALVGTGIVEMAVDEGHGGWGATVVDLALVAEQHGRALASAPIIETQVAARVLAQCGAAARDALGQAMSGEKLVTFAPRIGMGARFDLVPAGTEADAMVAYRDDQIVLAWLGDDRRGVENLASMPLADIELDDDVLVLADGQDARRLYSDALDTWLTLTGLALAGMAGRAVEMGVDYAKQRHAFGTAIGSFQAVSHPLADSATAADGARLLGLEAACAFTDEPARASELAAMAFVFAYETARDATRRTLHFHGGYGFGMEQDIQLYYRRARGWAMVYAEPATVLDRVAEKRYGPVAGVGSGRAGT